MTERSVPSCYEHPAQAGHDQAISVPTGDFCSLHQPPAPAARLDLVRHNAVLLDALGTLVKLEPPAPRLRHQLRERFGLSVTDDEAHRAMGKEIAYYRAHLDEGRDEPSLRSLRRRCARVLWRELTAAEPSDSDAIVEALLASLEFTAFQDASPALRELKARGLRLAVVSNWDISLLGVLQRLGLAQWLDGVVTSAFVGARKPGAEIFQRALALVHARPEEAVHVGDSLEEDIVGAREAGIDAVWMVRGHSGRSSTHTPEVTTISTLGELLGLLSR